MTDKTNIEVDVYKELNLARPRSPDDSYQEPEENLLARTSDYSYQEHDERRSSFLKQTSERNVDSGIYEDGDCKRDPNEANITDDLHSFPLERHPEHVERNQFQVKSSEDSFKAMLAKFRKIEQEADMIRERKGERNDRIQSRNPILDFNSEKMDSKTENAGANIPIIPHRNHNRGLGDHEFDYFQSFSGVKYVEKLIHEGKLPTQNTLDEMCRVLDRKSEAIVVTCKAICDHIKSIDNDIIHVWAAYTLQNRQRITFVIILEKKSADTTNTKRLDLETLVQYAFIKQYFGEFRSEATEINKQEQSTRLDNWSLQTIQNCISKHSEDLMKKHKYLSIISASCKRSKGFGSTKWELLHENCIVLYVHTKKYIPIEEEPFETHYDGIAVDVREGAFIPFGQTAREKLEPIKMGCQIGSSTESGTLGCFIDHPQFGLCGLTCAHVLLNQDELKQLKRAHGSSMNWPFENIQTDVFQPDDKKSLIGHTVKIIYKDGSAFSDGMDVALFKVTDRKPNTANFPEKTICSGGKDACDIQYDNWRICSSDKLKYNHVVKFGSVTDLRAGTIEFVSTSVKILDIMEIKNGCTSVQLFKQIEVKSNDIPFATKGDSGSLVFAVEGETKNTCIGILVGGTSYEAVIVSPIVPILKELGVSSLKCFESEINMSTLYERINQLDLSVQASFQTMDGKIQALTDVITQLVQKSTI